MLRVSTDGSLGIRWHDLMRTAVGILLAAQVGVLVTASTMPTSAGLALLVALSVMTTGAALRVVVSSQKFYDTLEYRVELRTKDLVEKMTAFEKAATTDALTGLLNRRGGEEAIQPHIARSRRLRTAMSFVLVDIDRFKQINDTHGHAVGDRVLELVSATIRQSLRIADLPVRWGGEEILVCLPDTDLYGAAQVAEKLRSAIAMIDTETRNLTITASFGCAELGEDDFAVALARADMQMYLAKSQGRNRVCPQLVEKTS